MAQRAIKNLGIKQKLLKEYLDNGGYHKIYDPGLLQDIIDVKFDGTGNAVEESISARLNAFMGALLASETSPPFFDHEQISEYSSLLQKDLYFEQQTVDTVEQADQFFNDFAGRKDIWFRGQREARWRLYNKAQRQWITDKIYQRDVTYADFLKRLVNLGKEKYTPMIHDMLKVDHIDTTNDIAILGFLQHHGCPTPMMDWTDHFQVGLFFALYGIEPPSQQRHIHQYVSLYYTEKEYFQTGSMRALLNDNLNTVSRELLDALIDQIKDESKRKQIRAKLADRSFFDRSRLAGSGFIKDMLPLERMLGITQAFFNEDDPDSGLIFSLINNKNILQQSGVFIWNASPTVPFEMVAEAEYEKSRKADEPADFRFCKCLNIHKSLASYLIERLAADGVTAASVYPTTAEEVNTWNVYEEVKASLNNS